MYSLEDDLILANKLIEKASAMVLASLKAGLTVRSKADGSPVTNADEEVARAVVRLIQVARPLDAVLCEELGRVGTADRCWIIDPIDGTFNLVRGSPHWGTNVALQISGEIVLGVISRPAQSQSWWATRDGGAYRNDWAASSTSRISVSDVSELTESKVAVWAEVDDKLASQLKAHVAVVEPDLNAILDVAEGRLEGAVDTTGKPWDHAPYVVLVEEAGGRCSDARGGRRIDLGEVRYTNSRMHEAFVGLMQQFR